MIGLVRKMALPALLLALAWPAFAQQGDQIAATRRPLSAVQRIEFPTQDNEALLAAELERRGPGIAPRFAVSFDVDITPNTHGNWEVLPGGIAVWRLRLHSPNAYSLNLGFTEYYMPPGGRLLLYSPDKKRVMGPFTPADNEEHEQLWTPVLDGDEMVIELQVPMVRRAELKLHLTSVNHDFLGFSQVASGSCNLDVICGAADGWAIVDHYRDIIQSVGVYGFNGSTFCTGFLINNARNDCTPYFMTANHCGVNNNNAATVVIYWNYQNSVCRQPNTPQSGGAGNGQLTDFNSGTIFRASYASSDFTLVELDDPLSATANGFFAGWTIADQTPQDTVIAVHHPNTDEKRISFSFQDTYRGNWGSGSTPVASGNHVIVPDYDIGTTEGGSSGCPLFDAQKRVVGQLHGGGAACGNNSYDSYGWFTASWTGGGANNNSLRPWLDPDNTGITSLDGRYELACSFYVLAETPIQSVCAADTVFYTINVSENFTDTVTLSLSGLPAGSAATLSDTTVLPGASVILMITGTGALSEGSYTFMISGSDNDDNAASSVLSMVIQTPALPPITLSPANGTTDLLPLLDLSWTAGASGVTYEVQLALDDAFTNIVADESGISVPMLSGTNLESSTTYYWRVRVLNLCGMSDWSTTATFTTATASCILETSTTNVPISPVGTPTITSTLEVTLEGLVSEVHLLGLDIQHTWTGDLAATLISPTGTEIILFERPGVPASPYGCDGDDLMLDFYDAAANTADDLENSCGGQPAITGPFQSVDPMSGLAGEPASGTWTLRISDAFSEDGGALRGWQLQICTAIPDDNSLIPSIDAATICINQSVDFELLIGTGFDLAGGVALSATGLPNGATVAFSENPAMPGSTVTATIAGISDPGDYTITIEGADGQLMGSVDVQITVEGAPEEVVLVSPANDATGTPIGLSLQWQASPTATSYQVILARDPDFMDIVTQQNTAMLSANVTGLSPNTDYYWKVVAVGMCGSNEGTNVFHFHTAANLSFTAMPNAISECTSVGSVTYSLQIGNGFTGPVSISYEITPTTGLTPEFSVAVDSVYPGTVVAATFDNLPAAGPGQYTIVFTLSDGALEASTTVMLTLLAAPDLATLLDPANETSILTFTPTLSWSPAARATSYTIEVATDNTFTNIIQTGNTTSATSFTLQALPGAGDYYWRVSANNACGNSLTAAFHFVLIPTSVNTLQGRTLTWDPNPTQGMLHVRFSEPLSADLKAEVLAANGQKLWSNYWQHAPMNAEIDLSNLPAAVYMVRLTSGDATITQRIVKQ